MPDPAARRSRLPLKLGLVAAILAVLGCLLAVGVDNVWEAAERSKCNLSGVGHAFLSYKNAHGGLPPAVVYDKGGTPLHSWRVLLLPYLSEEDLYKEFRLDEPWDSPHNLALLPRMPEVYAPPGRKASRVPPHHTVLHVFVGKGTAFEPRRRQEDATGQRPDTVEPFKPPVALKVPGDFPRGASNTLLFVEAGEPVPWTKPQELAYDPDGLLPDLRPLFRGGIRACMADGSRRFIPKDTPEADLRALISRNGGEAGANE